MAQPTLYLDAGDATKLGVSAGDRVTVKTQGRAVAAQVYVNGGTQAGLALLNGVPYLPGTAVFEIEKSER